MVSGIVYFSEILEQVKDLTGYTNIIPYVASIRRFVFLSERDIGYGGMIIKKSKNYSKGDGSYAADGLKLILPSDFIEEDFLGDIDNANIKISGNFAILTWDSTPPDNITFSYMGILTDDDGDPITTRNHFNAVINYCLWKMYSPRVFLGQGNASRAMLNQLEFAYTESVLAARGNDVMPTEQDWGELGNIIRSNRFELITDNSIILVQNTI